MSRSAASRSSTDAVRRARSDRGTQACRPRTVLSKPLRHDGDRVHGPALRARPAGPGHGRRRRGVEVVLPRRAAEREAAAAVRELGPGSSGGVPNSSTPGGGRGPRRHGALSGRMLTRAQRARRTRVHRRGDELLVPDGRRAAPALERWYRRAARDGDRRAARPRLRAERTALHQADDPRPAHPLGQLLAQRRDELQLAAAAGAREVLDYVVWHEVCHLQVMDHSPRFWGLLARTARLPRAVALAAPPRPDAGPVRRDPSSGHVSSRTARTARRAPGAGRRRGSRPASRR